MTTKIGINRFGRIGRLVMRAIMEKKADIDVAVVNDLADTRGHPAFCFDRRNKYAASA
ncbi:glyceraldehyde 3-phosphate dehydrogenase NAD-binding domain-containing protein [Chloroflexota bacterium]